MRGPDPTILRRISQVRSAQRVAAEQAAAAAAAETQRLEASRAERAAGIDELQRCWRGSVSGPALDIAMVQAWAASIATGEAELAELGAQIDDARDHQARRRKALRKAQARQDCAAKAAKGAAKATRRWREDRALTEAADAFLQRWGGR